MEVVEASDVAPAGDTGFKRVTAMQSFEQPQVLRDRPEAINVEDSLYHTQEDHHYEQI